MGREGKRSWRDQILLYHFSCGILQELGMVVALTYLAKGNIAGFGRIKDPEQHCAPDN